ncbi:MAG: Asp-tRNA(Asn)/Glu-tRNA(Gln) amidotransferase subunit GatA [Elusimicrobia bacterium]|nr:Asp-tRNA(Asn)/Glu-tRNA(Gln) amidotransferase subunit GatA [Elusimicrobiota bacterium]
MTTAIKTAEAVRLGKIKAEDVIKESLKKIHAQDGEIGAFIEVFDETALSRAKKIDEKKQSGRPLGKLAGAPVAIKDNILYFGHKMTCASKILEGYVAPYSATVVEKLLAEDAVIVGRTNMDEFAMGSSCENSSVKITKNPLDKSRVPGGSSGGSSAAVAAKMACAALGSDTGGSVRQPAAVCGVVGLKPTYGAVSRWGLSALASSLDQIGPLTADVSDSELLFSVLSGRDPRDSTSRDLTQYKCEAKKIKDLRIGLPKEYFIRGLDVEIEKLIERAVEKFSKAGAKITEVSLPHTKYAMAVYCVLMASEACSNLARYDGIRYGLSEAKKEGLSLSDVYETARSAGFGPEVKRRIMLGAYTLSSCYYDGYYLKANKVRQLIKRDFENAFKQVDMLITPTAPTEAFKLGEKISDPEKMQLSDIFTTSSSLAGVCAISVPCGFGKNGLPAGVQFIADNFNEQRIFDAGKFFETDS